MRPHVHHEPQNHHSRPNKEEEREEHGYQGKLGIIDVRVRLMDLRRGELGGDPDHHDDLLVGLVALGSDGG